MTEQELREIEGRSACHCLHAPDIIALLAEVRKLRETSTASLEACRLIVAVADCMMLLYGVHDTQGAQEILEKHGVENVQLLAKAAQDKARAALEGVSHEPL